MIEDPTELQNEDTQEKPINEYLSLRAAKIARNQARLQELGLLGPFSPSRTRGPRSAAAVRGGGRSQQDRKYSRPRSPRDDTSQNALPVTNGRNAASGAPSSTPNLRRSKRLNKLTTRNPEDGGNGAESPGTSSQQRRRTARVDSELSFDTSKKRRTEQGSDRLKFLPPESTQNDTRSTSTAVIPANSARAIALDVDRLLLHFLGRIASRTGKKAVMMEAACVSATQIGATSSSPLDSNCVPPFQFSDISFNKYSGVQEWANNVIFLWINLGDPKSDVINSFRRGGQQVTWFGGSRMHWSSPIIQKLASVGSSSASDEGTSNGGIVLWCRQYNPMTRTLRPYICLGRLKLIECMAHSRPLEFVWELLDYDQLLYHKDESIRTRFQAIAEQYTT